MLNTEQDVNSTMLDTISGFNLPINLNEKNNLKTEVGILESPLVLEEVFNFVKKRKSISDDKPFDLVFKKWKNYSLNINLEKDTSILNVEYRDSNKDIILPVLNKISESYQNYSGRKRLRDSELGNKYFVEQISIFKNKSAKSLKEVQEYAMEQDLLTYDLGKDNQIKKNNVDELSVKDTYLGSNFLSSNIGIEKARVEAANRVRKINLQLLKIKDLNDSEDLQYFFSTIPALVKDGLPGSLRNIDQSIASARLKYTPNDIFIKNLIEKRTLLVNLLKIRAVKYLEAAKLDAEATMKAVMRPKGVLLKYKELIREAQRDEVTLVQLEDKYNLFKLELATEQDPWELITSPTMLNYPVEPNKKSILAGYFLFGIFISVIIAGIIEKRNYLRKNL